MSVSTANGRDSIASVCEADIRLAIAGWEQPVVTRKAAAVEIEVELLFRPVDVGEAAAAPMALIGSGFRSLRWLAGLEIENRCRHAYASADTRGDGHAGPYAGKAGENGRPEQNGHNQYREQGNRPKEINPAGDSDSAGKGRPAGDFPRAPGEGAAATAVSTVDELGFATVLVLGVVKRLTET